MSQVDPKRIEHLRARTMAELDPTDAMPGECPGPGELAQRLQQPLQLVDALERWVYILGTDRVFDLWLLREYPVRHLRYELAGNAPLYKAWLTHPARRQVAPEDIVFEPSGHCLPHQINLWRGFPLAPVEGDCGPILELVEHLMSETAPDPEGRARHVEYLLHWLAYPLQHPGAKLRSALVFHGPQGCGKSLLFEGVMARIYGEYSRVIGQAQLESKYTDWASRCLFVVADEVLAPGEAAHYRHRLKALITGETLMIEAKFATVRQERNAANLVFLSNEQKPLALEADDRRHYVVWCPPKRTDDLYARVGRCIDSGGLNAFLAYLLGLDTSGFDPYAPPPLTQAKRELVELGLRPAERFVRDWLAQQLELPVWPCSTAQLYRAFARWCRAHGERSVPAQTAFTAIAAKAAGQRLTRQKCSPSGGSSGAPITLWLPSGTGPLNGVTWYDFATQAVAAFDGPLRGFCRIFGEEAAP